MEQDRISSRDPGAILPPVPFIPSEPDPAPAQAPLFPPPPARAAGPAPDHPDDDPPVPSGMASAHLPAIIDPLEPQEPDTAHTRTRRLRHDGWTPDRQRRFLERFAECGIVSEACAAAGMSARAAYNLRDRNPLFAAGWDAACLKVRPRLADEAFSRSMTGIVERIYKDGVVVAERHRHDNRLTMAVLARLDARLDKAVAEGAPHLDLAARWEEFLDALGEDRRADVAALLAPQTGDEQSAETCELRELQQEEAEVVASEPEESHSAWWDAGCWWTNFPPPPDYEGRQVRRYGSFEYRRQCTAEEAAAMEARRAASAAELDARRAAWFGLGTD